MFLCVDISLAENGGCSELAFRRGSARNCACRPKNAITFFNNVPHQHHRPRTASGQGRAGFLTTKPPNHRERILTAKPVGLTSSQIAATQRIKLCSGATSWWRPQGPEFNAKAQSRQVAIGFFIAKPGNQESAKKSHGFLASLCVIFLVAPLRLGGLALNVFCLMADCKVWLTARSGRAQGPGQKANGQRMAGPGPDLANPAGTGAGSHDGSGATIRKFGFDARPHLLSSPPGEEITVARFHCFG